MSFTTLADSNPNYTTLLNKYLSSRINGDEEGPFYQESTKLHQEGKSKEYISQIFSHISSIIDIEDAESIESILQIVFSLIYYVEEADKKATIKYIVSTLTSEEMKKKEKSVLCLKALTNLSNLIGGMGFQSDALVAEVQLHIICSILSFACATNEAKQVEHLCSKVDVWVQSWNLSDDDIRQLLKALYLVLKQTGESTLATELTKKYIGTYKEGVQYKLDSDVEDMILSSLLYGISLPITALNERASLLDALRTREYSNPIQTLILLLTIICDGSLPDFNQFKESKTAIAICDQYKLSMDKLEHTMKLLALTSMAATTQSKVMTFESIKNFLNCKDDEVEMWVIEAISENLLDADIDQMNYVVNVSKCAHRSFGSNDWKNLQERLAESLKGMTSTIESLNNSRIAI